MTEGPELACSGPSLLREKAACRPVSCGPVASVVVWLTDRAHQAASGIKAPANLLYDPREALKLVAGEPFQHEAADVGDVC